MSRLLVTNKSFELLEPYEGKTLTYGSLEGKSSRKGAEPNSTIDQYTQRGALVRSSIRPGPFQRAGLVGRRAGAPAYPQ